MKTGFCILFAVLLLGQLGGIPLDSGIVVYAHDIVVAVLISWLLIRKRRFVRPKLLLHLLSFIAVATVSLLFALSQFTVSEVGVASLYLVRFIMYAALYVMIVQIPKIGAFLLRGLFITGSMFSLLGLMQYVLYPNLRNLWYLGWDPHHYRLFSTFLDPNFAGLFIVLTIVLGFVQSKSRLWWGMQTINVLALYLTYSRGSYLSLIAAAIVWIILEKRWRLLWFVVLGVIAILLVPRPGGETLSLLRSESTMGRITNWQQSIGLIARSPIFGHGFNTLRFIQRDPVSRSAAGVDNSFLYLLATTGILGLSVYVWFLWSSKGITKVSHVAILTALIVHSQFTNSLFYPWILVWFFIYLGASEITVDR